MRKCGWIVALLAALLLTFGGTSALAADEPFTFGMLLVGPYNDHGWSQAHFEGGNEFGLMIYLKLREGY